MLDAKMNPLILEVNEMPSFASPGPIDYKVKRGLITDTIKLLCLNIDRKKAYITKRKEF